MKEEKPHYYMKKNQISMTTQEKIDLINEIGWFTKDIQRFYRYSYPVALSIFKKVAKRYGTLRFDKRQVKTEDVMAFMNTTTIKEKTRLIATLDKFPDGQVKTV